MKTFSVKNFQKFQHYKDRAPPWIKLYNDLLDDYEFGLLPDASKMHLIAIWLLASRSANKIPFDPKWVARRINANDPVNLQLLADRKFILLDQDVQGVEQDASAPLAKCLSREETETEGEETEEEQKETREIALFSDWPHDFREQFWTMYPNKVGKPDALSVLEKVRRKGVLWEVVVRGLVTYIRDKPADRAWCNPATWLRQGRWDDQPANVSNGHAVSNNRPDPAAGRATAREAQHVASVGSAALRFLKESSSARSGGDSSGSPSVAGELDPRKRAENAH